jgi:hypothetical protein
MGQTSLPFFYLSTAKNNSENGAKFQERAPSKSRRIAGANQSGVVRSGSSVKGSDDVAVEEFQHLRIGVVFVTPLRAASDVADIALNDLLLADPVNITDEFHLH